jgi:hypothetical protein
VPLFRRRTREWEPPHPRCMFVVSCAGDLPHPTALSDELPAHTAERIGDLVPGVNYMAECAERSRVEIAVDEVAPRSRKERRASSWPWDAKNLPPEEMWPYMGLTADLVRRLDEARYNIVLTLHDPGDSVDAAVLNLTLLADKVALVSDGCVNDVYAMRFFGPATWRVPEPIDELDVREHMIVHAVPEQTRRGTWLHTHGLVKFGRPEVEVYDVAPDMADPVAVVLNEISDYVITRALVRPGHTLGDPETPIYAREGRREREHWQDTPVLELVDVDEGGRPVRSGAPRGLAALLALAEGES